MAVSGPADRIRVDIDELVFTGFGATRFTAVDRERIAKAFTRELSRLLRVHGMPDTGEVLGDIAATLPDLPRALTPYRLGTTLAQAIHSALTDPPPTNDAGGLGARHE
jgi:hypothetical protein